MSRHDDALAALRAVLDRLLNDRFPELLLDEPIEIAVGRRARRRLASVRRGSTGPLIRVNPLLLLPGVPQEVLDATVAHELCHIVHGFATQNAPKGLAPHRGGIVDAELDRRGLRVVRMRSEAWLDANWNDWYTLHAADIAASHQQRAESVAEAWRRFLAHPRRRTLADLEHLAAVASARSARPPLTGVRWLLATKRDRHLSYRSKKDGTILFHALLAHPSVPECVILCHCAIWLSRETDHGADNPMDVCAAVLPPDEIHSARRWEIRTWPGFRRRHFPY